ncbi:MAG: DUF975 family protein [Lachnospiraceae bacterium]|nr:DUF975 family protein [Lachnospiraceae bacterium]
MWTRQELKQTAKEALKRNYWKAVLVSLILIMLGGGATPATASGGSSSGATVNNHKYEHVSGVYDTETGSVVESVVSELEQTDAVVIATAVIVFMIIVIIGLAVVLAASIFIANPLIIGARRFMLKSVYGEGRIAEVGYAFDHSYLNCVKTMFYREMYIFLWMLLFIIPGIYKKYQYYMVEYILAENPEMPYKEVLELSKKMMDGHKWNTFVLDLSFILWHMLGMITCGITEILYVCPYINLTHASLYYALCRNNNNAEERGYNNELQNINSRR